MSGTYKRDWKIISNSQDKKKLENMRKIKISEKEKKEIREKNKAFF